MTGPEEAIAALQAGRYEEADRILDALGAGKTGAGLRERMLWAITQILRMHFTSETAEAVLEVARRFPNGAATIYQKVLSAIGGPLDELLMPAAAQEVRLRIGGFFLRRGGDEHEAAPWLIAACEADENDGVAAYLEASSRVVLFGEHRAVLDMEAALERAVADVDRSYLMSGRTEGFYYHLGHAHERIGNFSEAAEYYAKAMGINPENDIPRVALGTVLIELGRVAEAVELLSEVSRYAPDYLVSARLRAVALFHLGRIDEAVALLEELGELDPLGAVTFLELGRIHLSSSNLEKAEIALARAFRTDPGVSGLKSAVVTLERLLGRHMDPDAGLPTLAEFTIPDQFRPRFDEIARSPRPDFKEAIRNYVRVIEALIIRDILALYAHSGMGYFWALAQPLVFIGALAAVYMVVGHKAPFGTSIIAFLTAGVVPYISFYVRIEVAVAGAVRGNVGLLYFRQVTPLALISAAALREFLTSLVIFVIIACGVGAYDTTVNFNDPLTILFALIAISMLGVIVGTVFGLGELMFPSVQLIETVFQRVMFFFSGILYYANTLSPHLREYALLNPMLHLIEFVRNGFFAVYHSRYANWHYPLEFIAIGSVMVMLLLYSSRRYMAAS